MTTSTLTKKNQTTIPKAVVKALGLRPSAQLIYEIEGNERVILTAKCATFASLAGSFPKKNRRVPRTAAEMKAAVKRRAGERYRRSVS